jgi:alcohol dehydrogenase class IV
MVPRADELNQAIALKAIKMIFEWLPKAFKDGNDLMPRIKMQQAAMMAGIPLSNAGSGISHALGHTIGGLYHIHHGAMVLLFLPYELQVYSKATDRYLEICDLLCIRDIASNAQSLSNLIEKIRSLMSELKLPANLQDAGVSRTDFEKNLEFILDQTPTDPAFYFGWFDLTREQLRDLFLCAYEGRLLDMNSELWR